MKLYKLKCNAAFYSEHEFVNSDINFLSKSTFVLSDLKIQVPALDNHPLFVSNNAYVYSIERLQSLNVVFLKLITTDCKEVFIYRNKKDDHNDIIFHLLEEVI